MGFSSAICMCGDRGRLYNCNSCPHALCNLCVSVPTQYTNLVLEEGVKFLCVSCHWSDDIQSGEISPYLECMILNCCRRNTNLAFIFTTRASTVMGSLSFSPTFLPSPATSNSQSILVVSPLVQLLLSIFVSTHYCPGTPLTC